MLNESPDAIEQREEAKKWLGGVLLAIVLVVYGLNVLWAGHASIQTRRGILTRQSIELDGFDAKLYGVMVIVAAAALHCGLYWRVHDRYWRYGEIGVAITGIGAVVLLFWLLGRQFMSFV